MSVSVLYSSNSNGWMISSLVVFLPFAIIRSLTLVIMLGKAMEIQDEDLIQAFSFFYSNKSRKVAPVAAPL